MALVAAKKTSSALSIRNLDAAQKIWDYMKLNQSLTQSDVIIALGSNDLRVAEVASDLFLRGMADWIVMSGKSGLLTKGKWPKSEAEMFLDVATRKGVPGDRIIVENQSTNSGENARFTYALLTMRNITVESLILVQKPFMERRAYATFMKQWPRPCNIMVTSQNTSMMDYPNSDVGTLADVISVLVGDMQRLPLYAERGFQIVQEIPPDVWEAYNVLVESGWFGSHLI
ncbi:uncharacterized protein SCO4629-like [Haliotis cracherodii]|uniref:uncharacterized protein SCO4629-like n=1 Tax=Haliotis cracherodii TaxID=6455 RepID=UPI0039ED3194